MPKVSALTSAVTIVDTDIIYVVSGTSSLKATVSSLAVNLVTGGTKAGSFTSLNIVGSALTSNSATVNVFPTVVTTLNIGAAATTLNLGVAAGNTNVLGNFSVAGTLNITNNQSFGANITVAGDAAINGGDITSTSGTFNILETAVSTINLGAAATNIRLGYTGTASSTTNISTNATASAATKTINLGTAGAAGSTTAINIGSTAGTSTTTINGTLAIGTATASTLTVTTTLTVSGTLSFTSASYSGEVTTTSNSALQLPVGTDAQRPTGANGKVRFNTTLNRYEGYNATLAAWSALGGGAGGGGTNQVFYENDTSITSSYTITTNKNAMTAGPVTIANGVTVTVPNGSAWSII